MNRKNGYAEDTAETSTTSAAVTKVSLTLGSPDVLAENEEWFVIGNYLGTCKSSGVGAFEGKVFEGFGGQYGTVAFHDKDSTDYNAILTLARTYSYLNFLDALEVYAEIDFGIRNI